MNTSSRKSCAHRAIYALLFAILLAGAAVTSAAWKAGAILPDLKTLGVAEPLPAMTGKVVLVDFWASWCSPCKASFPVLNTLQQKYSKSGRVIIAINEDEKAETMQKFLAENTVTFTIIRDVGHKLVEAAAVDSMPSSFLIDKTGKVRFTHTGFHGDKTTEQYIREIEQLLREDVRK